MSSLDVPGSSMVLIVAMLATAVFFAAFALLDVVKHSKGVLRTARTAIDAIRESRLEEVEREKIVQQSSIRLLRFFLSILLRCTVALAASFVPVLLADRLQLASQDAVMEFLSRWDVIAGITAVVLLGYFARGRGWFRR